MNFLQKYSFPLNVTLPRGSIWSKVKRKNRVSRSDAVSNFGSKNSNNTVVKKRKLTDQGDQNIFSRMRGIKSFWDHCIMVGVLHDILWLYQYNLGERICLILIGKEKFADPGPLTFLEL